MPDAARACAAGGSSTLVTRAARPRRIGLADSSKSFLNFSSSEGIFNFLPKFGQE
jgi:hypothetical protein